MVGRLGILPGFMSYRLDQIKPSIILGVLLVEYKFSWIGEGNSKNI
jgi:hypothetical protein